MSYDNPSVCPLSQKYTIRPTFVAGDFTSAPAGTTYGSKVTVSTQGSLKHSGNYSFANSSWYWDCNIVPDTNNSNLSPFQIHLIDPAFGSTRFCYIIIQPRFVNPEWSAARIEIRSFGGVVASSLYYTDLAYPPTAPLTNLWMDVNISIGASVGLNTYPVTIGVRAQGSSVIRTLSLTQNWILEWGLCNATGSYAIQEIIPKALNNFYLNKTYIVAGEGEVDCSGIFSSSSSSSSISSYSSLSSNSNESSNSSSSSNSSISSLSSNSSSNSSESSSSNIFYFNTTNPKVITILSNRRSTPYKNNNDRIQIKLETYKKKKISYIENASYELYINTGTWSLTASGVTNRYGMDNITLEQNFGDIENCLGIVKLTHENTVTWSNPIRFNFK